MPRPLVKATLQARYPTVRDEFFRNLYQATGAEVTVTVGTFLEHLDQLGKGEGAYEKGGPAAGAVLSSAVSNKATVADAKKMIVAAWSPRSLGARVVAKPRSSDACSSDSRASTRARSPTPRARTPPRASTRTRHRLQNTEFPSRRIPRPARWARTRSCNWPCSSIPPRWL